MEQDTGTSRGISDELLARLTRAARVEQVANDAADEYVAAFLGVSRSDARCLDIVDQRGRITAGRLAAESGLTTGGVTALVDRLEQVGYLRRVRDTADRRKVFVETTPLVRRIIELLFMSLGPMYAGMLDQLTEEQVETIVFFLEASAYVKQQRARLLQDLLPDATDAEAGRLAAAAEFDRAARKLAPSVAAHLRARDFPRDFCDAED